MRSPTRPLFVWRLLFRLNAGEVDATAITELEQRLHSYRARIELDDGRVLVHMRVVGYDGPASAVGDAAQSLRHHAAQAGLDSVIVFVSAERFSARMQ